MKEGNECVRTSTLHEAFQNNMATFMEPQQSARGLHTQAQVQVRLEVRLEVRQAATHSSGGARSLSSDLRFHSSVRSFWFYSFVVVCPGFQAAATKLSLGASIGLRQDFKSGPGLVNPSRPLRCRNTP